MPKRISYKDAGVDLDAYQETMGAIQPLLRRTHSPRVMSQENGFAGLFRLDYPQRLFARRYRNPVLVSGTDGVGTKLKVAIKAAKHDTVGIDLVAMSVNDCLCTGAEPLFFLDYIAMSSDDTDLTSSLVAGVVRGCELAGCALLGGETAIMPDIYAPGDYDMAGFCVGVVERNKIVDGSRSQPGDIVLGVASSGLHSNGFSLARKIVFDVAGLEMDSPAGDVGCDVATAMLEPTTIYAGVVRTILSHYRVKRVLRGIAHVTGGGLIENVGRIVPKGRSVVVHKGSWTVPPVFGWLQELGDVDEAEMHRTFNMGIGLVLIVSPYYGERVQELIERAGPACWRIGEVTTGDVPARFA